MPLYAMSCPCGKQEDRFCSYETARDQKCDCGQPMQKLITGAKLIGPTDTNPVTFSGHQFTSSAQIARWENSSEAKGLNVLSRNDPKVKSKIQEVKHQTELRAQKHGYKSERSRQAEVKKEARMNGETLG